VLPRLAYLTLCRSIQLLALLAGGDAAKDLEILVLDLVGARKSIVGAELWIRRGNPATMISP
jgi:hypothetical protein